MSVFCFGLPDVFNGIFWIHQVVHCMISAICVYLKLGFTTKKYHKVCKYPHQCCLKCVENVAERIWQSSTQPPKEENNPAISMEQTEARLSSAINGKQIKRQHTLSVPLSSDSEAP